MQMQGWQKAFVMLSAAVTMTLMGTAAAEAGKRAAPPKKGKVEKNRKTKRAKVHKVRKARRRPADFDPDLSMPAGTAYDVIARGDIG